MAVGDEVVPLYCVGMTRGDRVRRGESGGGGGREEGGRGGEGEREREEGDRSGKEHRDELLPGEATGNRGGEGQGNPGKCRRREADAQLLEEGGVT